MQNDAPDPRRVSPAAESSPRFFIEHYIILAIWIASIVLAISALVR